MAAKIADCKEIVAVDRVASRLRLAMDLGATHVINTAETGDLSSQLKLRGGFDFVIDTTGVPKLISYGELGEGMPIHDNEPFFTDTTCCARLRRIGSTEVQGNVR